MKKEKKELLFFLWDLFNELNIIRDIIEIHEYQSEINVYDTIEKIRGRIDEIIKNEI